MDWNAFVAALDDHNTSELLACLMQRVMVKKTHNHIHTPTPTPAPKKAVFWDAVDPAVQMTVRQAVTRSVGREWMRPMEVVAEVEQDLEIRALAYSPEEKQSMIGHALRELGRNGNASIEWNGVRARGSKYRNPNFVRR